MLIYMDGEELELLLSLDGASYEMAPGVLVEFTIKRTAATPQRPHGISYSIVLRPKEGGAPWVRFEMRMPLLGVAAAVLLMTIGTGRSMTTDALTSSRQQSSCSMIFG